MIRYFLVIFCVIAAGCGGDSVPTGVMKPDKMRTVLWDVLRADEIAVRKRVDSANTTADNYIGAYRQVLTNNKVSKEDFKKSLQYYQTHPADLKPILDSLQKMVDKISGKDSTKKPAPRAY
jgi:hypothetical protein